MPAPYFLNENDRRLLQRDLTEGVKNRKPSSPNNGTTNPGTAIITYVIDVPEPGIPAIGSDDPGDLIPGPNGTEGRRVSSLQCTISQVIHDGNVPINHLLMSTTINTYVYNIFDEKINPGLTLAVRDGTGKVFAIPRGSSPSVVASINSELIQWDNADFTPGCQTISAEIVEACDTSHGIGDTIDVIFIHQEGREINPDTDWVVCSPVDVSADPPLYIAVEGYLKGESLEVKVVELNSDLTAWDNEDFVHGCEIQSGEVVSPCEASGTASPETVDVVFIRREGREPNLSSGDRIQCVPLDLTANPQRYLAVGEYLKVDTAAVSSINSAPSQWTNGEGFEPGCQVISGEIVEGCGVEAKDGNIDIIVPHVRGKVVILESGDHVGIAPVDMQANPPLYIITTDYTGYEEDCGIDITDEGKIRFDNKEAAGLGLVEGEDCKLDVDIGCGLQFVSNEIWVDPEDLAGPGLIESGSCGLAVNAGCGLQIVEDVLLVDNKALAGQGLVATQECELEVNYGCGLNIDTGQLVLDFKVNEGNVSGISFDKDCFEVEGNEKCGTAEVSLKIGSPEQEFEYVYEVKCVDDKITYYTKFAQFTACGLFVGTSDESLED